MKPLLRVNNLSVSYALKKSMFASSESSTVFAVQDVSFTINTGEVVGLVGESGCGKSSLARSIMRLIEPSCGEIVLDDLALQKLSGNALRKVRHKFQMVFQDPYASLDPRMNSGDALAEAFALHKPTAGTPNATQVVSMLKRVGLGAEIAYKYPHELSGGMRQRVAIARALAPQPMLLIADEPVSALDVSVRAQILNLLGALRTEFNYAMLFISHDITVVNHIADRVIVMYAGSIVEAGLRDEVLKSPAHPYSRALIAAVPDPYAPFSLNRKPLPFEPPSLSCRAKACSFHTRCPFVLDMCKESVPKLQPFGTHDHVVACFRVGEI